MTACPTAYRAEWSLFVDWCQATGRSPLGTDAATVKVFLDDCPSAAATARRRISAINRAHRDAGYSGHHLRGYPSAAVAAVSPADTAARAAVLMRAFGRIPAYGWPSSVAGIRDGCLLALAAATGMGRPQLRSLAVGDITAEPGVVRVSPPGGAAPTFVHTSSESPATCPACGITRWHRVLALHERHGLPGIRSRLADPPETAVGHHCARPLLNGGRARMSLLPRVSARGLIDSTGPAISTRMITKVLSCRLRTPDPVGLEHGGVLPHRVLLDPDVAATRRAEAVAALADVTDVLDAVELETELAMVRLAELVAAAGG